MGVQAAIALIRAPRSASEGQAVYTLSCLFMTCLGLAIAWNRSRSGKLALSPNPDGSIQFSIILPAAAEPKS